ncbi:MAG TPA: methyltransferase domain-containing protein, partial [Actinomycetota bacterium]|nr:methyltransferase domain-containing protein [Actinomycetota bacterium]
VLDVGCGPGAATAELVRRLGQDAVAAVDPSERFVAAARVQNPRVDVRVASADHLPYPDGTFDATIAQLVVHFMTDPDGDWTAPDFARAEELIRQAGAKGKAVEVRGFRGADTGLKVSRYIDRALRLQTLDPPRAFELWAEVEHRLVDLAPWVFLVNPVGVDLVSERVGNYERNPQWGLLLDQLWVR